MSLTNGQVPNFEEAANVAAEFIYSELGNHLLTYSNHERLTKG